MTGGNIIEGTEQNFSSVLNTSSTRPVLVDFYAPWCKPCKTMSHTIEQLIHQHNITVLKINVDQSPQLSDAFQVLSLPTLLFVWNGKVVLKKEQLLSEEQLHLYLTQLTQKIKTKK